MMLIAASCPSNRLAAVTKRSGARSADGSLTTCLAGVLIRGRGRWAKCELYCRRVSFALSRRRQAARTSPARGRTWRGAPDEWNLASSLRSPAPSARPLPRTGEVKERVGATRARRFASAIVRVGQWRRAQRNRRRLDDRARRVAEPQDLVEHRFEQLHATDEHFHDEAVLAGDAVAFDD